MADKIRANAANTQENRTRILDAAATAFMEAGFEATTVDEIARRLKSTKGRIYYSYPSKTALLIAVVEEGMARTEAAVADAAQTGGGPRETLAVMARAHALQVLTALPYHSVTMDALDRHRRRALTPPERRAIAKILKQRDAYEVRFADQITEAKAAGELREVDAMLATRTLFGAINSTAQWFRPRRGQPRAELDTLAQDVVSLVIDGLTP